MKEYTFDLALSDDEKYQLAALVKQRDEAALKRLDAKVEVTLADVAFSQANERCKTAQAALNKALDEESKARDILDKALGLK